MQEWTQEDFDEASLALSKIRLKLADGRVVADPRYGARGFRQTFSPREPAAPEEFAASFAAQQKDCRWCGRVGHYMAGPDNARRWTPPPDCSQCGLRAQGEADSFAVMRQFFGWSAASAGMSVAEMLPPGKGNRPSNVVDLVAIAVQSSALAGYEPDELETFASFSRSTCWRLRRRQVLPREQVFQIVRASAQDNAAGSGFLRPGRPSPAVTSRCQRCDVSFTGRPKAAAEWFKTHTCKEVDAVTATALMDKLERIERAEAMRGETLDRILQTVDRLEARYTGDERVVDAVAEFRADLDSH